MARHLVGETAQQEGGGRVEVRTVALAKCRGTVDCMRLSMAALGWKMQTIQPARECSILWYGPPYSRNLFQDEDFETLLERPWARSSKMPGMSQCMVKSEMTRLFRAFERLMAAPGLCESFYPPSLVYPTDRMTLLECKTTGTGGASAESHGREVTDFQIIKPAIGSQGTGIKIVHKNNVMRELVRKKPDDETEALKQNASEMDWAHAFNAESVVQNYIENPLLLDGMKFDFRLYVLVCNVMPLKVYLCNEGLVRLCTMPYTAPTPENVNKAEIHLSNYSLQKTSTGFVHAPPDDPHGGQSSKRSLSSTLKRLKQSQPGFSTEAFWEQACHIVRVTMAAIQPVLWGSYWNGFKAAGYTVKEGMPFSCFHILGFDMMADTSLHLSLLEGNCAPSFSLLVPDPRFPEAKHSFIKGSVDTYVKERMLTGALRIVNHLMAHGDDSDPLGPSNRLAAETYMDVFSACRCTTGAFSWPKQAFSLPWGISKYFFERCRVNSIRRNAVTLDGAAAKAVVRQLLGNALERMSLNQTLKFPALHMSPSFVENISVSDLARSRTLKELIASVSRPSYTLTEFIEQVCCVMYDTVGMDPASLSIVASPV
jgi:hypothetical protein